MDTQAAQIEGAAPVREVNRFQFDGKGSELFLLMLVNYILTVFTLGIYSFWGRTRTRKYIWSHFSFNGDRLEYTGTGKELFVSFLKVFGVFLVFGMLVGLITHFAPTAGLVFRGALSLAVFLLIGFAQYSARNYRLQRTRWRGIRMGMTNARKEYMKVYVIYSFLTGITLGFMAPVRWVKLRSILINNTRIGSKQLTYTGSAKDIYWQYMGGIFLSIFTLGIYYFWHQARLLRYDYNNTHLGDCQFKSIMLGGDLFFAHFVGLLMVVFSAGLATPWALRLIIQTHAETLAILGRVPIEEISQGDTPGTSALGEEVAEFLDVDFGF